MWKKAPGIGLHIIFWIGIWFFYYYFFSYNTEDKGYVLWFSSLLLPLTAAITYFVIYFLIPRYLYEKKYGKLALMGFYTLVASAYFIVVLIYGCMFLYNDFDPAGIPPMVKNFFFIMILVYLVVGLVSFITVLRKSLDTEKQNRELQNKMLSTQLQLKDQELLYLKKQIHPHFLFNTLNTIYGFALKKSGHTPEIILKLSNLLDYILYQVEKPRVSLAEEVMHIKEYIELERIRFSDSLLYSFDSPQIDESIQIAPMLLIPFVENAFKHGELVDGHLHIDVEIKVRNKCLDFKIRNSVLTESGEEEEGGIGLENLKKRLDLNYNGNYQIDSSRQGKYYHSSLTIMDLTQSSHE